MLLYCYAVIPYCICILYFVLYTVYCIVLFAPLWLWALGSGLRVVYLFLIQVRQLNSASTTCNNIYDGSYGNADNIDAGDVEFRGDLLNI